MSEVLNDIKILGFWRYFFARFLYRPIMKVAHRFNWHYAPEIGPFEDGSTQLWCKWCGFRMDKTNAPSPLKQEHPNDH